MSQANPTDRPQPETLTVTRVIPGGHFALLVARRQGTGTLYEYDRISTDGSRKLLHHSGTYHVGHWQDAEEGLCNATALYPDVGKPAHEVARAREILVSGASWTGPAGEAYRKLGQACGPSTLGFSGIGADVSYLDEADATYGRGNVERVLARLPILAGVLDHRTPDPARAVVSRIVSEEFDLDGLAALLGPYLDEVLRRLVALAPADPALFLADRTRPEPDAAVRLALRRMAGIHADPGAAMRVLALCHLAPRDWAPGDARSVVAMDKVLFCALQVSAASAGALPVSALVQPVAGNWTAAEDRLRALSPGAATDIRQLWTPSILTAPIAIARGINDMVAAYATQVLSPALTHVAASTKRPVPLEPGSVRTAAWRELFSGKGLLAIAGASADWHARAPDINAIVRDVAGVDAASWTRPFPDFEASNGLRLVPLLSVSDLVEEGAVMRHCVGSYGPQAASGHSVIVSVRDATGTRRSTVEFSGTRVVQHKGRLNGAPAAQDAQAVAELAEALRRRFPLHRRGLASLAGSVRRAGRGARRHLIDLASPGWSDHPYNPHDPNRIGRVTAAWGSLIPRQARGSIAAIVARQAPEAATVLAGRRVTGPAHLDPVLALQRTAREIYRSPFAVVMFLAFLMLCLSIYGMFDALGRLEERRAISARYDDEINAMARAEIKRLYLDHEVRNPSEAAPDVEGGGARP